MKKILFNDKYNLTQAVLEGRKTQTRRIVKGVYSISCGGVTNDMMDIHKPYYKVGEVVAVAQSYCDCGNFPDCEFDEDGYPIMPTRSGFFIKMFVRADLMPHQIRITNVRIERLQDISEEDCLKEGIIYAGLFHEDYGEPMFVIDGCKQTFSSAKDAYIWLIDKISGKGTWENNPYVFVYDFELVK